MSADKSNDRTTIPQLAPSLTAEERELLDNKTIRKIEAAKEPLITNEFVKTSQDGKKIEDVRFYPDRPTQRLHKDRFIIKEPSKFYDPCAESSKMAIRCMENHDEDYKEVCGEYFRAYRECKKEWMEQRKKDNRNGGIW
jgi:cytochrome c oxidase assembly protein subunit 23